MKTLGDLATEKYAAKRSLDAALRELRGLRGARTPDQIARRERAHEAHEFWMRKLGNIKREMAVVRHRNHQRLVVAEMFMRMARAELPPALLKKVWVRTNAELRNGQKEVSPPDEETESGRDDDRPYL